MFTRRSFSFLTLVALWALVVAPIPATAQGVQTATLRGTVTLEGGEPAPGVLVTAQSDALQGQRTAFTGINGDYILRGLPAGNYTVTYSLDGFQGVESRLQLGVGNVVPVDVQMSIGDTIEVTGENVNALAEPTIGANYDAEEVDNLPLARNLSGIALLSPGLSGNGQLGGQVTISGGLAYDNAFLLNGVDINDSVFGNPDNLFIEDAIEETQILTSSVSAEYGRFGGGVVNAITKSGGNQFEGTLRVDLTNPDWRDETPLEAQQGTEREDDLSEVFQATLGGYLVKDKLWFFLAGRDQSNSNQITLLQTGIPFTQETEDQRLEGKLTANLSERHSLQATFIDNDTSGSQPSLGSTATLDATINASFPNDLFVARYAGIWTDSLFTEVQYSEKNFSFEGFGGTSTDIQDSPFLCLTLNCQYNAPYFDATDPEDRNNEQLAASASYFLQTAGAGSHDVKVGFERFNNIRTGGNSQTATDATFFADFVLDAAGNPVLDANGKAIPIFTPGASLGVLWDANRGSRFEIETDALYVNDRWTLGDHWSFNLGARYESVTNQGSDNIDVVDADRLVPRVSAAYDVKGDGRYTVTGSYAEYGSAYNLSLWTNGVSTGNPAYLYGPYVGPAGQGVDFAPGFDLDNYLLVLAGSPTQNVRFADGVKSPVTREWTLSGGMALGQSGYLELSYQNRDADDLLEDFILLENGTTQIVVEGVPGPVADNIVFDNSNVSDRRYEALILTGRYDFTPNWAIQGHWTHQLENNGNYEGENGQQIITSGAGGVGDFPELFNEARNFPSGRLDEYQQDRIRLWTTYQLDLNRFGGLGLALLLNHDSPTTYSLSAANVGLTAEQLARNPGYAQPPLNQTLYFGERGSEEFDGFTTLDASATYRVPFAQRFEPWLKLDVRNLFNDDTQIGWNTTVVPNFNGPLDELGLPTTFTRGANFGNPRNNADFVIPRELRLSAGIRF